jgi:hypothetical protein
MTDEDSDQGVIQAIVDRLEKHRLPMALQLQEKVNRGETLNDLDLAFLDNVFQDTRKLKGLLDRHPDWQPLATRMINLYKEITTRALENEQRSGSDG